MTYFALQYLVYQGSLNFIMYFDFLILKELMVYFSSCFNNTDNKLLVVQYYMLLVVSGFQEMNSVHISYLSFFAGLFLYVA